MSAQSQISQVVTSYIKAMYEWEISAVEKSGQQQPDDKTDDDGDPSNEGETDARMNELFSSNGIEGIEKQREWILAEYCTSMPRNPGYHFGLPTQHHPELEQIVAIKVVDELHAEAFTNYEPDDSYSRQRRYDLLLCEDVWLIDQHYLLDEEGEFPEL